MPAYFAAPTYFLILFAADCLHYLWLISKPQERIDFLLCLRFYCSCGVDKNILAQYLRLICIFI